MNTYVVTKETEYYSNEPIKKVLYAGINKEVAFSKINDTSGNRLVLDVWFDGIKIKSFIRIRNGEWQVGFDKLANTKKEIEDYSTKLKEAQSFLEMLERAEHV
ncbi:hypothetical protein HUN88_06030 [Bacillus amyloliquefaciens]|uniref:hypothetical protein n=1 Tax=Bacillus amyloliquefaciens TaxID=1390 RepID=UPI0015804116|nr:hypothetical protein [Bacillus amyloliquefaciens]NUI59314.1 hypothetical protein [Bacillus amyloliquefaciens]